MLLVQIVREVTDPELTGLGPMALVQIVREVTGPVRIDPPVRALGEDPERVSAANARVSVLNLLAGRVRIGPAHRVMGRGRLDRVRLMNRAMMTRQLRRMPFRVNWIGLPGVN
jgi:hypothetical protein